MNSKELKSLKWEERERLNRGMAAQLLTIGSSCLCSLCRVIVEAFWKNKDGHNLSHHTQGDLLVNPEAPGTERAPAGTGGALGAQGRRRCLVRTGSSWE